MAKCDMCGNEFTPKRAGAKYCSTKCRKEAWVNKRSKERAKRHKTSTRICRRCGNTFEWDSNHPNRRFCSDRCKRLAETSRRSISGERTDVVKVKFDAKLPHELDELRKSKGDDYFRVLFSLPKESQFAEMESWDDNDYEEFTSRFGRIEDDCCFLDRDETIVVEEEKEPFDEENQFQ